MNTSPPIFGWKAERVRRRVDLEGAQKGGLADAVAAQQTGELATIDGGIHGSSHHPDILLALIADTQLTQFYGLLTHGLYVLFELLHELV